jgi:hypothetical protein
MSSIFKWVAGTIGLIILAVVFPFVRSIYDLTSGNGTGILYVSGNGTGALHPGTAVNNGFIQFLPVLIPAIIVVIIIIYVVRKDNNKA